MPTINLPPQNKRIHPSIPFTVAILFLLYLGLNVWIYFYGTNIFTFNPFLKKSIETVSVVKHQGGFGQIKTPTPVPTPIEGVVYPLPAASQEWEFQLGSGVKGPKAQTATVNPLGFQKGGTQTVLISAKHDSPIRARATIFTDTKQKSADMKRIDGSDTDGTWEVTWTIDDTYDNAYHIDFALSSATGNWSGALTFR